MTTTAGAAATDGDRIRGAGENAGWRRCDQPLWYFKRRLTVRRPAVLRMGAGGAATGGQFCFERSLDERVLAKTNLWMRLDERLGRGPILALLPPGRRVASPLIFLVILTKSINSAKIQEPCIGL